MNIRHRSKIGLLTTIFAALTLYALVLVNGYKSGIQQILKPIELKSLNRIHVELGSHFKTGEIALTLILTSLDALAGGDTTWMQHFMKSSNKLTNGIPVEQIQNAQGLFLFYNC